MINNLFALFLDRKEQLKIQEFHDNKINENYHKCPLVIYKLLLLERKLNREQILEFNNNNLIDFYRKIKINLEKNNNYQMEIDKILKGDNICKNIDLFIKKF